jgi:hypothetical protein
MHPVLVYEFTLLDSNILNLKQTKMKDQVTFLVINSSLRLATTLLVSHSSCVIHDFVLEHFTPNVGGFLMLDVSHTPGSFPK